MKIEQETQKIASQKPNGTVTLLFSDIEGSTQLLHRIGDKYPQALEEQRAIVRAAFQQFEGYEIDTAGDAFFVAFSRAQDGVAAAIAAQRQLAVHQWPEGETLRVRMALHTGELIATASGDVGMDVHRAARLCSAGHGGQILISETTRQLVAANLPEGVTLRDLGEHRLKDLQQAEHIYQIMVPDLPDDFPPLKTLDHRPNNLPAQITPLVGREQECENLKQLLQGSCAKAEALLESARGKLRALGDNMIMGFTAWVLAQMAFGQGDFGRAAKLVEECRAQLKDRDPQMLWLLALVKQHEGDLQQAQALLEECLAKFRAWGYKWGIANALYHLGRVALDRIGERLDRARRGLTASQHDREAARACWRECMILNRELGNKLGVAKTLIEFGILALTEGDSARSARLFAAAEALHQSLGVPLPPYERTRFDREVKRLAALFAEETFAATWNAGKNMAAEQAVSYALET